MLTFGASRCSRRLAGGITAGPTAAGVRSIARMPGGLVLRRRFPVHVGTGRLEHQVGLLGLRQQPVDAFVSGLQAELASPRQAVAVRVDADHPARFQPLRAQQLVQQVGADVARPDNGGGLPWSRAPVAANGRCLYSKTTWTDPRPVELGDEVAAGARVDGAGAGTGQHDVAGREAAPRSFRPCGPATPPRSPGCPAPRRCGLRPPPRRCWSAPRRSW